MKHGRTAAFVIAALVLGLVVGGVVSSGAAPQSNTSQTPGLGMRLGAAIRDGGGRLADVVAELTGQSVEDVQAQRQAGTSFADIAEKADVSTEKVVDEALEVRKEMLDSKVADGTLTQEQADDAIERMEVRLEDRVESTDAGRGGCGGGGGFGGGRGRGGGAGGCGGCVQAPAAVQ